MSSYSIILTCEHAGNQVPVRYRSILENEPVLNTPRGWDIGALDLTVALSEELDLPCFVHQTTRLLVEVNCSLRSNKLFSEFSKDLGDEDKQLLLTKYYFPYRLRVENAIAMSSKPVVHLSIHTFTPALPKQVQELDIGILFDPKRTFEKSIAEVLIANLKSLLPTYQVVHNESNQINGDSFISYLRTRFLDEEYAGIEITVNQKFVNTIVMEQIAASIKQALVALNA